MFVQQREGGGARLVTSASDLTAASACEFAFLRRVDKKLGRDVVVPPDDDPMLARAAVLGDAHEDRVLAAYRARFGVAGGAGGGVAEIARPGELSAAGLCAAQEQTLAALSARADVVWQATFFEPSQRAASGAGEPEIGFVGFADFLQRTPDGSYEVQDTKLARRAKVTALMQLAAYAEQLERLGVPVWHEAVLILGDGARSTHRLADIAPVFRARRARLHELLLERAGAVGADGRVESADPVAWGSPEVAACGRCEVCEPEVQVHRDPLLIAGIRGSQRDRLLESGLGTIDAVAAALPTVRDGSLQVTGISQPVLERIALQASLQVMVEPGALPPVEVVDAEALAAIPAPNPGDLFFDFEGDPLYREGADAFDVAAGTGGASVAHPGAGAGGLAEGLSDLAEGAGAERGAKWGLDYLFGMVDTSERYTAIWAHDLAEERRALEAFLRLVAERRRKYPGMKIYHYASYERSHLTSIAARHGVGEVEVDQLLREHVLVDLYPIVRRALRVGSRSYSIKKLEPLYMGDELRDQDGITSGGQSVTEYAEASELLRSSADDDRAEGQRTLDAIADYNRYDCVSTLRLRDWLLGIAHERGVAPLPETTRGDGDDEAGAPPLELSTVAAALAMHASLADDARDRKAAALAASAIDYYQREQKSFWWAHFARLVDPIEDWADTRDVMVVNAALSDVEYDWLAPVGRQRSYRRSLRLRGEIAPGSSLKEGSEAYLVYEHPAPFETRGAAPGSRGARLVRIAERHDDGVTVEETRGGDLEEYGVLPVALTPGPPPRPGAQKGAIEAWGQALADSLDRGQFLADPVVDLMRRVPPRVTGGSLVDPASAEALAAVGGAEDQRTIGAVIASLRRLDRSSLAVQGPPGTGKTYLAARVIRTLVERDGWRIGVVAQSHKVVEHVLEGVVSAGLPAAQVGKVPQGGTLAADAPQPGYTVLRRNGHEGFLKEHERAGRGAVIGGTAWDFANETRVPRRTLDLLVVDEAGQFSLAPTIAASVAAQRLLLLGDPQQLPQVSQGTHPEPVDTSALGWLLGVHDTLPDGAGYFLAGTRRMRPELAKVVSELSYEGRLHAHSTAGLREVVGAGAPGLVWHPVEHAGNATSSPEEAERVVGIVRGLLGASATSGVSATSRASGASGAFNAPGVPGADTGGGGRDPQTTPTAAVLHEPGDPPRSLGVNDVIVVAPYNAQVECIGLALHEAGFGEVRVGTVDRFQGQEAAIAIVSLAASSAADVPRGLEFLLMRNRLNVAISRAQWAAHLVSSVHLGDGLPGTSEGVAALAGYLRLLENARRAELPRHA